MSDQSGTWLGLSLTFKNCSVPSIANEYKSNRKKHDGTAQHWTLLYAQPPRPVGVHQQSSATATVSRISNGKGKERGVQLDTGSSSSQGTLPSHSTSLSRSQRPAEVIKIDSDSEEGEVRTSSMPVFMTGEENIASHKRKRTSEGVSPVSVSSSRRQRTSHRGSAKTVGSSTLSEVVEIDSD